MSAPKHQLRRQLMKNWFAIEVCSFSPLSASLKILTHNFRRFLCKFLEDVSDGQWAYGGGRSYVIIGGVLAGASWYVTRLATGPNSALLETLGSWTSRYWWVMQSSGPRPILLPGTPSSRTKVPSSSRSTRSLTRGQLATPFPTLARGLMLVSPLTSWTRDKL